jgi:hypothetical protein
MAFKPLETIVVSLVSNIRNGMSLVKWNSKILFVDGKLKEERRLSPSICYPHDVVPLRTERWIDAELFQLIHLWVLSLGAPRDAYSPSPELLLQIATAFPCQAQDRIQMTPLLQRRKRFQNSMTFAVSRFIL